MSYELEKKENREERKEKREERIMKCKRYMSTVHVKKKKQGEIIR